MFRRFSRSGHRPAPASQTQPDGDRVTVVPIGTVRNGVRRPRLHGWEEVESRIVIEPRYEPALAGLDGFSHMFVLSWLHLAAAEPHELLAIHPGGDEAVPEVGVLALRVGGRPNPIGLSVVQLLGVARNEVRVRGLDLVDGTPVLDLKPYLPAYDSAPDASLPGWARGR